MIVAPAQGPDGRRTCPAPAGRVERSSGKTGIALYVLAMIAVVVGADILFLRHNFWARLIVNVAIVLVFVVFYFRFLKRGNRDEGLA